MIEVRMTNGDNEIIIANRNGLCNSLSRSAVRVMGRTATGVRGMTLDEDGGDEVIGMICIKDPEAESIMVVSEQGYGKRSDIEDYRKTNRGGKGVKCYKISDKTGEIVGAKAVNDGNEIMMITNEGIVIRMFVDDISILGRVTLGVKLMNTGDKDDIVVASITKVKESVTEADALEAARLAEENETLAEGSEELSEDSDSEDN